MVPTIKEKTFKQKIRAFLDEHFGSILAENYIRMIQRELGIKDLNKSSEKDQDNFIFSLTNKVYGKTLSPQDLKKQTYLVFYNVFGANKAMQAFGKSDITIQPITFVYFVFGKLFGEFIIEQCEQIYDHREIKKQDEFKQVIFVKRLLNDIFIEFPEHYRDEINLRFLIFLKFGENPEKDILKFLNNILSKDNYVASLNLMESILAFFGQNSSIRGPTDLELSDMATKLGLTGAEKEVLIRSLKEKVANLASSESTSKSEKGENVFSDVRKVLTSTLGVTAANEILSSAESALGITNLSKADVEKKKMLLSNILTQDVFSKQSYQKRLILEDKLKAILL